jgi:hypothetical protein
MFKEGKKRIRKRNDGVGGKEGRTIRKYDEAMVINRHVHKE